MLAFTVKTRIHAVACFRTHGLSGCSAGSDIAERPPLTDGDLIECGGHSASEPCKTESSAPLPAAE